MQLDRLSLINFKNFASQELELSPKFNCFVGDNGVGKTNVLDAVYYMSMCNSAFGMTDGQSIKHGEECFMLDGKYTSDEQRHEHVVCSFSRCSGKMVKRADKQYQKLTEHLGLLPVVMISPADTALISDSAEERRRFMNAMLSQSDRAYLTAVMRYNSVIVERNRLLKQRQDSAWSEVMEVLDMQLAEHGKTVFEKRRQLIERLQPITERFYAMLSGERETVSIDYKSVLHSAPLIELLAQNRDRDVALQFTSEGVHRDDITLKIGGYPLRKYGSQGQQKSFLIALKLSQFMLVAEDTGKKPILLLDDLFDKLDAWRVQGLIELVGSEEFGQIFITDCNRKRLERILGGMTSNYKLFTVSDDKIIAPQQ